MNLCLETLDDDFCPRPSLLATDSAVTITEQVARRREPGRISKATSRVDLLYIWSQWGKFRLPQLFFPPVLDHLAQATVRSCPVRSQVKLSTGPGTGH